MCSHTCVQKSLAIDPSNPFDGRGHVPPASRNVWINETSRTRSMLWHWDRSKPHFIKAILYLSDAPDRYGCFVALRPPRSNATYRLPWRPLALGGGIQYPKTLVL